MVYSMVLDTFIIQAANNVDFCVLEMVESQRENKRPNDEREKEKENLLAS